MVFSTVKITKFIQRIIQSLQSISSFIFFPLLFLVNSVLRGGELYRNTGSFCSQLYVYCITSLQSSNSIGPPKIELTSALLRDFNYNINFVSIYIFDNPFCASLSKSSIFIMKSKHVLSCTCHLQLMAYSTHFIKMGKSIAPFFYKRDIIAIWSFRLPSSSHFVHR